MRISTILFQTVRSLFNQLMKSVVDQSPAPKKSCLKTTKDGQDTEVNLLDRECLPPTQDEAASIDDCRFTIDQLSGYFNDDECEIIRSEQEYVNLRSVVMS